MSEEVITNMTAEEIDSAVDRIMARDWRPIESIPKDTFVLLWRVHANPLNLRIGCVDTVTPNSVWATDRGRGEYTPLRDYSHWMLFPPGPRS